MPKWQYKRFPVPRTPNWDHDGALARFSEEGWELVAVAPASGVTVEVWYFKRPAEALVRPNGSEVRA